MKRIVRTWALLAAVTALAACQKEKDVPVSDYVEFSVGECDIPDGVDPETRTYFTSQSGNSFPTLWTGGEAVTVFMQARTGGFKKSECVAKASSDHKTASLTPASDPLPTSSLKTVYFMMLSPTAAVTSATSASTITVSVPTSQTPTAATPDEAAMILAGRSTTYSTPPAGVKFSPKHMTAYMRLKLTNASSVGTVQSVTVTSTKPLSGSAAFSNATTPSITASSSETSNSVTAMTRNLNAVWLACLPAQIEGTKLTIKVTGRSGDLTRTITVPSGKNLESGKIAMLTVDMKPTVPVTGVTVSPTTLTLEVGKTSTLTATVTPSNATDKTVTWKSSNTSVATVSSAGVVTGVAAGTATITATTQDGGKTATCAVTVKAATIPVTGVTVSPTTLTLEKGKTKTLTATVTPSNATNQTVTWSSSNTSVATVSSAGVVTAKAVGNATITVTTQDGGKTATCAVTVTAPKATKLEILNKNEGVDPLYDDGALHITPTQSATIQYKVTYSDGSTTTNSGATLSVSSGSGVSISGRKVSCTTVSQTATIKVVATSNTSIFGTIEVKTWSDPTSISWSNNFTTVRNGTYDTGTYAIVNTTYNVSATISPSTARQKAIIAPVDDSGGAGLWEITRTGDRWFKMFAYSSGLDASQWPSLATTFKVSAWHNSTVSSYYTVDITTIDVSKPKMFDIVVYDRSAKTYKIIDGGCRVIIWNSGNLAGGVKSFYCVDNKWGVPGGTVAVGIVTAYYDKFDDPTIDVPSTKGLANPSQLITYGPDGAKLPSGKIHGFAIALYNAVADIWSAENDYVSTNANFSHELQEGTGSTLIFPTDGNRYNGFNLTVASHQYNVWRGSSHAIRPPDRCWDYGEPGIELTCRAFPDTNPSLTFIMRPWFVPTVYNWLQIAPANGTFYGTAIMNKINAQIERLGFGDKVFPYSTDSYWTINTNDPKEAYIVYSNGYATRAKSNSAGVRPFMIF